MKLITILFFIITVISCTKTKSPKEITKEEVAKEVVEMIEEESKRIVEEKG